MTEAPREQFPGGVTPSLQHRAQCLAPSTHSDTGLLTKSRVGYKWTRYVLSTKEELLVQLGVVRKGFSEEGDVWKSYEVEADGSR